MFDVRFIESLEKKAHISADIEKLIYDNALSNLHDLTGIKVTKVLNISTKLDYLRGNIENYVLHKDYEIFSGNLSLDDNFDCIFSLNNMHKINNLRHYLGSIRDLLNPKGIFFGSLYANDNLVELADSFFESYSRLNKTFVNHFLPLVDIKVSGSLMQSCGFYNVVVVNHKIWKTFDDIFSAMKDIRYCGEGNCLQNRVKKPIEKDVLKKANEIFLSKHKGRVTYSAVSIFCQKK